MLIWNFAPLTQLNWRKLSAAFVQAQCLPRVWLKISIPITGGLGKLVRDAARLARFGGLKELRGPPPHAIKQLFFYAVTPEAEPTDITPILIDISAPEFVTAWTSAMEAHATQVSARNYIELQLIRARLLGARTGVGHAIALFPNEPLVFGSLAQAGIGARRF